MTTLKYLYYCFSKLINVNVGVNIVRIEIKLYIFLRFYNLQDTNGFISFNISFSTKLEHNDDVW